MSKNLIAVVMTTIVVLAGTGNVAAMDVDIHGTVSQGWMKSSEYNFLAEHTEDGTFSFNEALINLSTRIDSRTRIGMQLIARDLGGAGNNEFVLDWAFGDYRWKDYLGFRAGKVKTPLGFYNKTRDVDFLRTSVLLPQSVYNEGWRAVTSAFEGFSAYGNVSLGSTAGVDYEVFGGTIEMDNSRFLDYLGPQIIPGAPVLDYDIEADWIAGGQISVDTPIDGLRVGATYMTLEMDTRTTLATGTPTPVELDLHLEMNKTYVLSAEYQRENLTLSAEYTRIDADMLFSNIPYPVDTDGDGVPDTVMMVEMEDGDQRGGYYINGSYRVSPRFEFGTYYSVFHPDWDNRDGEGLANDFEAWTKDICVTARFDITDNWLLKAEGHFFNGTGQVDGNINPDASFDEESWQLFAVKSSFFF